MRRHGFYSKIIFVIAAVFISAALFAQESMGNVDYGEWAKIVCKDLGCVSIGCATSGGNIHALGLITDQRPLEKLGLNFGQGSYRMTAKRLSKGRYVVSIQSMSRREDNFEKEVALKTKADAEYPEPRSCPVPHGKYRFNMAIKYDMRIQLGVVPWYEKVDKIVDFIDIRVLEPEKLAKFGIHGTKRGESNVQMLYLGHNRWKIDKPMGLIGPVLVYKSAKWSSEAEAPHAAEAASDAQLFNAGGSYADLPILPSMQSNSVTPKQETSAYDDSLLFPNSDFEQGDLRNWTASGNAFQYQPTMGDNPTARLRMKHPSRHQGNFWIGTYEKYGGGEDEHPGGIQGDRPTGALTSIPFEIRGEQISFLVGGGKQPNDEYVALVVDGKEVRRATAGKNSESMHTETWDVSEFSGQTATIVIRDQSPHGWGHINTDYFHFTGMIRPASGDISPEASRSEGRDRLPGVGDGTSLILSRAEQYDVIVHRRPIRSLAGSLTCTRSVWFTSNL